MNVERCAQGDHVVGEDAGARIPKFSLNRLCLASHLGLRTERLQLATNLAGQVAESREVGLHRVELANRLLFATAVLENSGSFFDESATIFGAGGEHVVESPLTDDDVHLTAEAGIAEQFLNVEQTASLAVDGIFTLSVAKQGARNCDFAVLDRQRAVGVVNREQNFGTTERAARCSTSEDDVVHLSATQGFRALLTHHPGERVDDVRLARAVGADHTRDTGFERERRWLGERLEALEGEAFQVHETSPLVVRSAVVLTAFQGNGCAHPGRNRARESSSSA